MANDYVLPLKLEHGNQIDFIPTDFDPAEDVVLAKGIAIESSSLLIEKDGSGNMIFEDENIGPHTLTELVEGTESNNDCNKRWVMMMGVL